MLVTMAVSIVGVLPKSVAYADETVELPDYDFRIDDNKMDGSFQLFKWNPSCAGADTVSFWNPEKKEFCDAVISTSPLTDSYTYYKYSATTDGGSILMNTSENKCHSGSFEARGKKYYFVWYDSKLSNLDYGIGVKKVFVLVRKSSLLRIAKSVSVSILSVHFLRHLLLLAKMEWTRMQFRMVQRIDLSKIKKSVI